MKPNNKTYWIACMLFLLTLGAACTPSGHVGTGVVTILEPSNGSEYPGFDPIAVRIDFSVTNGATIVILKVNGREVNREDLSATRQTGMSIFTWTPPVAGTYLLQAVVLEGTTENHSAPIAVTVTGCNPALFSQPILTSPGAGAEITTGNPVFQWNYIGMDTRVTCDPGQYLVQVSTLQFFTQEVVEFQAGSDLQVTPSQSFLDDCRLYFWRVGILDNGQVIKWSPTDYFTTRYGDSCSQVTCSNQIPGAPQLMEPKNDVIIENPSPVLQWETPETSRYCLPGLVFDVEVALDPNFTDPTLTATIRGPWMDFSTNIPYLQDDCHRYYWRVQASANNRIGPQSLTETFWSNLNQACVFADANKAGNCRTGPGLGYPVVWFLDIGETTKVLGRNEDGSWLNIERLDGHGACWISASLVEIIGNTKNLALAPYNPPPFDEPSSVVTVEPAGPTYHSCSDYHDIPTCTADPMHFGCQWDTGMSKCISK